MIRRGILCLLITALALVSGNPWTDFDPCQDRETAIAVGSDLQDCP